MLDMHRLNSNIKQWHVSFPFICVGLYMAETPNTKCFFGKTPKTLVFYHNVAQLVAVGQPVFSKIFSRTNKEQGNSADCNEEITIRYVCFGSKPFPLAKAID